MPDLFLAIGVLVSWILGYFLTWQNSALLCMIPLIILTFAMVVLPETPYWLIENGYNDLAE